jgi:glyoxylase-like metal-dependent hydrolase (beta-lactamase superfamily II)
VKDRDLSSALTYPLAVEPQTGDGSAVAVAPGVLWLRMPLFAALPWINVWAIADGAGWSIIDTGLKSAKTIDAWGAAFGHTLESGPVTRVVVTHMHPDHCGMAGWIADRFKVRLWMSRLEYLSCRLMAADTGRIAPADGIAFGRAAGWDDEAIERYKTKFGSFGETICPELKLFISGDQVLPRISSNVSVYPTEPEADPLDDWLRSLADIKKRIPDDVLVLPAHNSPFKGLHARIDELIESHRAGLARLENALSKPSRAVDVFGALFSRPITPHILGMATGEAMAHLNYLAHRGRVTRTQDGDGVYLWSLKP